MNLTEMRTIVRRDLHDEDPDNYRWADDELNRHVAHAIKELSESIPYEQKAVKATTSGSREIDISTITDKITIEAVEYPIGKFPKKYQPFSLWGDTLTLLGDEIPDGSNAYIYYGKLHLLDASTSTLDTQFEDLLAGGACGYAAIEWAIYAVNRINAGGVATPQGLREWGNQKLAFFRQELKRLGRRNKVKVRALYRPYYPIVSKSTDFGP
jgi:hypothetical protein